MKVDTLCVSTSFKMVAVTCHSSQEHLKCHGHLERAFAAERLRALVSERSEDLKPGSDLNSFSSTVKFSCHGDLGELSRHV